MEKQTGPKCPHIWSRRHDVVVFGAFGEKGGIDGGRGRGKWERGRGARGETAEMF